jgi:diguanylate cyclase (GGDEF)-like protein
MVNPLGGDSLLRGCLVINPDVSAQYLLDCGRVALLLLDREGHILDCNPYCLENLQWPEKPLGHLLNEYLEEALDTRDPARPGQCQTGRMTLIFNNEYQTVLTGHLVELDEGYLVLAHSLRLSDSERVAALSRITDELSNLTRELHKKNRELERANETITQLMHTDPLTGLLNRRQFDVMMEREFAAARRHGLPLTGVMMDLDHFKSINDRYGHDVGDLVLVSVAQCLQDQSRREDIVARFGGEEFFLLLPNTPIQAALGVCERMRKTIEELRFPEVNHPVTASFGVTALMPSDTPQTLIKRADQALYRAKAEGRNRVVG